VKQQENMIVGNFVN